MAQWKLFGKTLAISAVAVLGTTAVLALAGHFSLARGVGISVGYLVSVLALWLLFKAWDSAPHLSAVGAFYVLRLLVEFGAVLLALLIPGADPIGVLIPQLFGLPILAVLMAIQKDA